MDIQRIRIYGDPILRKRALRIEEIDNSVLRLIDDMLASMKENDGVGLAAPQIGESLAVIVAELPAEEDNEQPVTYALINPEIIYREGGTVMEEGCLSIPGIRAEVERPERIVMTARDRHGNEVTLECTDLLARVMCHEVDHLNGVLFIDRLAPFERELLREKLEELEQSQARGII
jgi:peptide deformylase